MEDIASPPSTSLSELTTATDAPSDLKEQISVSTILGKELSPIEWTDEKHSLYLKSMEASFVDQLYNSSELLSSLPGSTSSRRMRATPAGQFKVLQDGYWSEINFVRGASQLKKAGRSRAVPAAAADPWIQHFIIGCRNQTEASPSLPDTNAPNAASRKHSGSKASLCGRDSVPRNAEVTDQNFVDEKANRPCRRKRMRTSVGAPLNNDQVVPFRTFPTTSATDNHVSPNK